MSFSWTTWHVLAGTQVLHPVSSHRRTAARAGFAGPYCSGRAAGGAISVVAAPQVNGACGGPPTGTSESLHSARLVSGQLAISGPPLRGSLQLGGELRNRYFRSSQACDGTGSGCDLPVICRIEIGMPGRATFTHGQRPALAA